MRNLSGKTLAGNSEIPSVQSPPEQLESASALGAWAIRGLVFLLLVAGYWLTFSYDSGDALDAARWMREGSVTKLVEFRHLIQRLLPFWLWLGLERLGLSVEPLSVLVWWDFVSAALSVMLLYTLVREVLGGRWLPFVLAAAFATSHCVWHFAGSGRLYTTSMLFVTAAYFLAFRLPSLKSEPLRFLAAAAAGLYLCLAAYFWLVHGINVLGLAALLLLLPTGVTWLKRLGYCSAFGAAGLVAGLAILFSCLHYGRIPISKEGIQAWVTDPARPPTQLNFQSPMNAAYGQAHGIVVLPHLPPMVNGFLRNDPELVKLGNFPWQLSKFVFVWLLLALVYVVPIYLLSKSGTDTRKRIVAMLLPVAATMYFAILWLGTDRQRFMPVFVSEVLLAGWSVQELLKRVSRPRMLAALLTASVVFIAGCNLLEVKLPTQTRFLVLRGEWSPLKLILRKSDLVIDFGRDFDYQPLITYYANAGFLNVSNEKQFYDWDHPEWQRNFHRIVEQRMAGGGRVFVLERLALGHRPLEAAWSEKLHPRPTVAEFAAYLRASYCVVSGFQMGRFQYFELRPASQPCPPGSLKPEPIPPP
jgi:hypothetical protein